MWSIERKKKKTGVKDDSKTQPEQWKKEVAIAEWKCCGMSGSFAVLRIARDLSSVLSMSNLRCLLKANKRYAAIVYTKIYF